MIDVEIVDYTGTKRKAGIRLKFLEQVRERLSDFRAAYEKADILFRESEAEWFASEGGGTWPQLADSTLKWRRRIGAAGNPILHATGALERSMVGGPNYVSRFEPQQSNFDNGFQDPRITFGTNDPKASFHQDGWKIRGTGQDVIRHVIPSRGERPQMWDEITKVFTSHLSLK